MSQVAQASAADGARPAAPGTPEPEWRVLVERRLRRKALPWVLRARSLERRGSPRVDPDFIVAGAQKAGSTSLYAYLAAHPRVAPPLVKEINYFDLRADRGQAWYRSHFPRRDAIGDRITGEASPAYMVHPLAMGRIAEDLPRVKVVVILREPVSRLISHYRHSVKLGHEQLTLLEALAQEDLRVGPDLEQLTVDPFHTARALQKYSYLRRSLYADQVERIQRLFPDRSLFLRLEDLTDTASLEPLCRFLGIDFEADVPFEAHNVNKATPAVPEGSLPSDVATAIREDADRTCELLGWQPWGVRG